MNKNFKFLIIAIFPLMLSACATLNKDTKAVPPLRISLQQRLPSNLEQVETQCIASLQSWKASETAIIVCDMWDKHWCDISTARFAELAVALNPVLEAARAKGVKIVHAPSACMDYYKDYPGRIEAMKYKNKNIAALTSGSKLPSEENAQWPLDPSDDEGCESPKKHPT
jgi:hypothetical protein